MGVSEFQDFIDDFDHNSAKLVAAIPEIFPAMHRCPVLHSQKYGGYHVVSRREDVAQVARNHEVFASANDLGQGPGGGILIPPSPVRLGFLETDPPEHSPLRRVVTKWFAPSAVDRYADRMRQLMRQQIAQVAEMGEFDVVDDLANPITAMSTIDYLGMPAEDWKIFLKPIHDQPLYKPESPEFSQLLADIASAQARLGAVIAQRRDHPADDLITRLTEAVEADGSPLTDARIVDVVWAILGGGFDTTSSAMAHILRYLSENPDRRRELIEHPELIPTAADEFVRYFAPATFSGRTVVQPTTIAGVALQPGARILLGWAAANFDHDAFDNPEELRFARKPNRHLSYGDGVHRCLGARYAQLELVTFLEEMLHELPDFIVHGERAVPLPNASVVHGYIHLPASARVRQQAQPAQ